MDFRRLPTRDTPRHVTAELTRYAGTNPFDQPLFRVVLAQNVREQIFGTMRHMPIIGADALDDVDISTIEPEAFSSGEMFIPRYDAEGWILERWFPAHAWGSQSDWESATSEDGVTRLKGEFPQQGDYFMVNDMFHVELSPMDFWKEEIQKCLRAEESLNGDHAAMLSRNLYVHRVRQEKREQDYRDTVNYVHRSVTDPILATIGRSAQMVRDNTRTESGCWGMHLAAG